MRRDHAEVRGLKHTKGNVNVWEPGAIVNAEDVREGFNVAGMFFVHVNYADYVHRAADKIGIVVEVFAFMDSRKDFIQA